MNDLERILYNRLKISIGAFQNLLQDMREGIFPVSTETLASWELFLQDQQKLLELIERNEK